MLGALFAVACTEASPKHTKREAGHYSDELVAEGHALLARYECNRCHRGAELELASLETNCTGCHAAILDGTLTDRPVHQIAAWAEGLASSEMATAWTPDLDRAALFRASWLIAFLQEPTAIRPALGPMMPRLAIGVSEAEAIAAALGAYDSRDGESQLAGDVELGERLLHTRGCGACHRRGGEQLGESDARHELAPHAPDLAHASRLRRDALVRWLMDPGAMHGATEMPPTGFTLEEARAVAAYLYETPAPAPSSSLPARLPLLEREVEYAEIEARLFRRICWHCHGDPAYARGSGGPGNDGGFGFPGRGLNLATYEGAMMGARRFEDGEVVPGRISVLETIEFAGETMPRLVAHLWARHREMAGLVDDDVRGMPLGIDPVSLEDIQLVESWIAQGAPRFSALARDSER